MIKRSNLLKDSKNIKIREAFNKKKTEKSDIVQKGGWTPKPYFRKEWNSDTIVG